MAIEFIPSTDKKVNLVSLGDHVQIKTPVVRNFCKLIFLQEKISVDDTALPYGVIICSYKGKGNKGGRRCVAETVKPHSALTQVIVKSNRSQAKGTSERYI